MFIILILVFIVTSFNLFYIGKKIDKLIKPYIDIEVERLTNNLIVKRIHKSINKEKISDILLITKNNKNEIEKISYDTYKINKIKSNITLDVQNTLMDLNNGKVDNYFILDRIKKSKFSKVKNGIICDINIDSIFNSSLFANVGPTIPIKLVFSDQINSDIDIDIKEYGINNAIVEVFLVIKIKEQIIMPFSSKRKEIVIREPLTIDIIQGVIPNYYNEYLK